MENQSVNKISLSIKAYCYFVRGSLTQNKCRHYYMFEIMYLVFPFCDRFRAADWQMLSLRNLSSLGETHLTGKNSQKDHRNVQLTLL